MTYYVYILKSKSNEERIYIGYTSDLNKRIEEHSNPESSSYTRQYAPWALETYTVFKDKQLAQQFEIYLKSHSGRAFLRKHLLKA